MQCACVIAGLTTSLGVIASTLGAAKAMGLSREQITQALNLSLAANLALSDAHWRRLPVERLRLCQRQPQRRLRCPPCLQRTHTAAPIFEGRGGFFNAVSHEPFALAPFGGRGQPFKILECSIKHFPLGLYSQTVADAILEVRQQLPHIEDIQEVTIQNPADSDKYHGW